MPKTEQLDLFPNIESNAETHELWRKYVDLKDSLDKLRKRHFRDLAELNERITALTAIVERREAVEHYNNNCKIVRWKL